VATERSAERVIILHGPTGSEPKGLAGLSKVIPQSEVVETHSLDEYLAALSKQDFDVVVLDYDLPEVQTKELLAQLRLRDNEPDVLILSKCTDPVTIRNIAKAQKRYVVREEGWVDSMAHAIRDMLRIRRLEQEMSLIRARLTEANQRLEDRNRRLDDFCATIAHDIRGPLAGLVLKVEYILETQAEKFDDRTVNLLNRSVESTRRLVGVVQAMYEFAKIGFSGAKFSSTPLTPLVQEVMADINIDHSNDVDVKMQDLPVVWGSADLLRRVFQNLFVNAIKYCHQDKVEIQIRYKGLVQRGVGEFAHLEVSDNGPGIAAADAGSVFNMFSRGAGADRGSDGLGIGLAIVQRIVELHQGSIELVSEPGESARFIIYLPTSKIEPVRPELGPEPQKR
jgi:signal transduction histidine kinase